MILNSEVLAFNILGYKDTNSISSIFLVLAKQLTELTTDSYFKQNKLYGSLIKIRNPLFYACKHELIPLIKYAQCTIKKCEITNKQNSDTNITFISCYFILMCQIHFFIIKIQ